MKKIIFYFILVAFSGCVEKVTKSQKQRIILNNSGQLVSLQFFIGDQIIEDFTIESENDVILTEECIIEGGDLTGCTLKWTNDDLIQPQKCHIIFNQEKIIRYTRLAGSCIEGSKNILASIPFQFLNPNYPTINCGYTEQTGRTNTYLFEITEQDYEEAELL